MPSFAQFARLISLCVTLCLFLPVNAWALDPAPAPLVFTPLVDELGEKPETPGEPSHQWNLSADKLTTLDGNTIIEAEGGVVLTRGNDVLKADFARYYAETDWIFLKGNVFVHMGKDKINAAEAEFDLRSQTGWLVDGDIFMEGQHTYFKGQQILKHRGDRYTFKNAKVTTCDGLSPAWSVSAQEAVVEIDGYAQLYHSNVQIKDQAVFYSPFMVWPAKKTRQSGFLIPDFGYSSKRGVYYTQPYYWVIDESSDLTFYAGLMSKHGFMPGVEYRSHPFTGQKTWLSASGFYDSKSIAGNDRDTVLKSNNLRTNHERYWLRGMADGFIGSTGWQYRTNIDLVSDQNYLSEFRNGPLGFDRSRDQMFDMFGRDITEDDQNRISQALLFKDWQRFSIVAGLRYEQNPILGHGNAARSSDTVVQQLPTFDAYLYKGGILKELPLDVEGMFTTGYMYRQSGTSGLRSEFYPKFSVPLNMGLFSFIGTAGVRQTWYSNTSTSHDSPLSLTSGNSNPRQNDQTRTIPDFDVKAYTSASRVWSFEEAAALNVPGVQPGQSATVALRHEVQTRVRYQHVAHIDQEKNPFYTDNDRILAQNELTWSFINIFTRKQGVVSAVEEKPGETTVNYAYVDLLRWKLEWGYDFNEAKRNMYLDDFQRRPFKDIYSELDLYAFSWASLVNKIYISPYTGDITRANIGLYSHLSGWFNWSSSLDYRTKAYDYRKRVRYENRDNIRLASAMRYWLNTLTLNINSRWSVELEDRRNLSEGASTFGRAYEQRARVIFSDQCYRIFAEYKYDDYDKTYSIMFELPGLLD